jgi:hypothetical protein
MKRSAFLTIVIISGCASLLAQPENKSEFSAAFSFETVNNGLTGTDFRLSTSFECCFDGNGLHLLMANNFFKHFGVADVSAQLEHRTSSFGTATAEIRLSLYNFSAGPQGRFANTNRFVQYVMEEVEL